MFEKVEKDADWFYWVPGLTRPQNWANTFSHRHHKSFQVAQWFFPPSSTSLFYARQTRSPSAVIRGPQTPRGRTIAPSSAVEGGVVHGPITLVHSHPNWPTGCWKEATDDELVCQTGGHSKTPRKCLSGHCLFCPRARYSWGRGGWSAAHGVSWTVPDDCVPCAEPRWTPEPHQDTLPPGQKNETGQAEGTFPLTLQRRVPLSTERVCAEPSARFCLRG